MAPQNGSPNGNGSGGAKKSKAKEGAAQAANKLMDAAGVSLGPIGLTVGSDLQSLSLDDGDGAAGPSSRPDSYASLSTEEWRSLYERDGAVDLWVEEEFNSGSRLVGGSAVYRGGVAGYLSGEGPGAQTAQLHKVTITNNFNSETFEVEVPEDRCGRGGQGAGRQAGMAASGRRGSQRSGKGVSRGAPPTPPCLPLPLPCPPPQVRAVCCGGAGLRPALCLPPGLLHLVHGQGEAGRDVSAPLAGTLQGAARPGAGGAAGAGGRAT